jgi:N-acetylglutamate synthase-like GNAT family acetyltransferase
MHATNKEPASREIGRENHPPVSAADGSRAHEHLELDGTFWLETAGAHLGRWFSNSPKSDVSLDTGGWIARSGEPWIGFNVACVLDSPRATALFERYASAVGDLPGVVIVEQATREIFELAERIGARHIGELPFMVFDKETAPSDEDSVDVRQIATLADLTPTVVLIAESFSMNVQACLDLFEPMLKDPNAAIWVAEKDGRIIAAVMILRIGSIVGLHCLATSQQYRGQGVARSLVCQLMTRQMSMGTRRFFLHTTARGLRFAEAIGYRPVKFPHGFVINHDIRKSSNSLSE